MFLTDVGYICPISAPVLFLSPNTRASTGYFFLSKTDLANPILSLVDTATVGQFGDSVELASLGPGCALCDMVVYLANFLAVATTSLLAGAIAKNDIVAARRHVGCAFSISLAVGFAMSGTLYVFGEILVGLFAGDGEAARTTLSRSLSYVRIRGAGSAPTLLAMVAQAACIGAKDADSPLRAIAVVSVFNIFLDWLFVGPFKRGVAGAAWATTIAQTAGAIYLYMSVQATLEKLEAERTYDGGDILFANKKDEEDKPAKRRQSLLVVPTIKELLKFLQFAGPMFVISLCRGASWNITTPAAAICGTIQLAAHQVVLNVFFFFTIAGEAVFQTAQVPRRAHRQTCVAPKQHDCTHDDTDAKGWTQRARQRGSARKGVVRWV